MGLIEDLEVIGARCEELFGLLEGDAVFPPVREVLGFIPGHLLPYSVGRLPSYVNGLAPSRCICGWFWKVDGVPALAAKIPVLDHGGAALNDGAPALPVEVPVPVDEVAAPVDGIPAPAAEVPVLDHGGVALNHGFPALPVEVPALVHGVLAPADGILALVARTPVLDDGRRHNVCGERGKESGERRRIVVSQLSVGGRRVAGSEAPGRRALNAAG